MPSEAQQKAAAILRDLDVARPEEHPFYAYVTVLEKRSVRARWVYPLVYVAVGLLLFAGYSALASKSGADLAKGAGALIGVAAALVAFWKPGAVLKQSEASSRLPGNRKLAGTDIEEFNRLLALHADAEKIFKLAGAGASFLAAFLLLLY